MVAAGVGHHAVGAEVVAAPHDRDESADAVFVEPHGGDFGVGLLGGEQHVDPLAARFGFANESRQVAIGVRPGYDVDARRPFEQLFLQPLGHAAEDADDQRGFVAPQPFHVGQPAPDALLCIVADRAGVYQDHVGLLLVFGVDVALLLHYRNHDFRIADVHLTTVGLDVEFSACPRKRPQGI